MPRSIVSRVSVCGAVLLCALLASCSSCDSPVTTVVEPPPPSEISSGFTFADDAFSFENFGGDGRGVMLTPSMVERMFGRDVACRGGIEPCQLTPVAAGWMEGANMTLDEGRSEGMAVTSLLFHSGALDPKDFGAETVGGLSVIGNRKLQEEIAYWAATQSLPDVMRTNLRQDATTSVPFLFEALSETSEKHYRLAIARRTETGFGSGHALTPIGMYKGEGDVYWLRVYDNNFPARERKLELNPVANTWRYEVPAIIGDPIVYEGTAENKNFLYFSAVEERQGVLQAPFSVDSTDISITYAGIQAVAKRGSNETGLRGGQVLEGTENDRVIPGFSKCPRCGTDVPVISQALAGQNVVKDEVIEIELEGNVTSKEASVVHDAPGTGKFGRITATGPDYTTSIDTDGDIGKDKVSFNDKGETTYTSNSGNGVSVSTNRYDKDNDTFYTTSVSHSGSKDASTPVTVKVTQDADGNTVVEVENLPAGEQVTVTVRRDKGVNNGMSQAVTFTSNGSTSRATLSMDGATASVQNADNIVGGNCGNGVLNAATETDVDCGGECNQCTHNKTCAVDSDCKDGTCVQMGDARVCQAQTCVDGVKGQDETDVDCGGSLCSPCTPVADQRVTPMCLKDSDCSNSPCLDGRCRLLQPVIVRAQELKDVISSVSYRINGGPIQSKRFTATQGPPYEMTLDDQAYTFQMVSAKGCDTDYSLQTTGITSDDDTEVRGVAPVVCPAPGSHSVFALLSYNENHYTPLQRNDPLKIEVYFDDLAPRSVDIFGDYESLYLGGFERTWRVRITKQPENMYERITSNNTPTGQMGNLFCEILYGKENVTTPFDAVFRSNEFNILCGWASEATCTDGVRNQDETDVDCGGSTCPTDCGFARACFTDMDCAVGTCVNTRCDIPGTCTDMTKNQDETDVDCGGNTCGVCASGAACASASDCQSGVCTQSICAAPTCTDGIKNQDETDIDCGGATCNACVATKACAGNTDCVSKNCRTNVCVAATCSDNILNQDESDRDCGGSCPNKCALAASCNQNTDCINQLCQNNVCVASCVDGVQNQDETGIDCGGATCAACMSGGACTLDSNCASTNCECGVSSGNCAGDSGMCGVAKLVVDQPTSDGVAPSGTFTVPSGCTSVFVQAWGAAGGAGDDGFGFGPPGGSGGYINGTLTVTPGDVITAWVGQGGSPFSVPGFGGTPGIGSRAGTLASGGQGAGNFMMGLGASGGGLTSVQVTGAGAVTFVVPAGAGAGSMNEGAGVTTTDGGGAMSSSGESANSGSGSGGGGAGEEGGLSAANSFTGFAEAGSYGTYPPGFTTFDSVDNGFGGLEPAGTTSPDYSLCQGIGMGMIGAGKSDGTGIQQGGDGCVVLRCVAQ